MALVETTKTAFIDPKQYDSKTQEVKTEDKTPVIVPIGQGGSESEINDSGNRVDNKINELVGKYTNITKDDIAHLLQDIFKITQDQLSKIDAEQSNKILDCLEEALKQCSKNNEVDKHRLEHRAQRYKTLVVDTGNTIEEANKAIEEFKNKSLVDILQKKGYIESNVSISEISDTELEAAVAKFINTGFEKAKDENLSKEEIAHQMKNLGRLLANCTDEERARIGKVINNIIAKENVCPALNATINSFIDKTKMVNFLKSITPEELESLGLPPEAVQEAEYLISANLDEEGLREHSVLLGTIHKKYVDLHPDVVEKIKNGEELNEEEELIKQKIDMFKSMKAGNISGTANNQIISDEFKQEHLANLIEELKTTGDYEEVLGLVKEFAQQHPEYIQDEEVFNTLLQELTNNEYESIKTPTEKKLDEAETVAIGYSTTNRETPNTSRYEELKANIIPQEEKNTFIVEKNEKQEEQKKQVTKFNTNQKDYKTRIKYASSFSDILKILADFSYNKNDVALQSKIEDMIEKAKNPVDALNELYSSLRTPFSVYAAKKGILKSQDQIDNLAISGTDKSNLKNIVSKISNDASELA